jgi:hypothetical protein
MTRLDIVKDSFVQRAPLMQEHIALDKRTGRGWIVWSLLNDDDQYDVPGWTVLEYYGVQVAYLPFNADSERQLRATAIWLEQWRRAINLAYDRGEQPLLWLTSALLRLAQRTYPGALSGLHIETAPRMG